MGLTQVDKTNVIIKAFYDVYNELGYGFLENVYQNALYKELMLREIPCVAHPKINVYYKKEVVGYYEADIIAFDSVILELKAVSQLTEAHEIQLVNYLKATTLEVGLLLNFGPKPEFQRKVFSHYYREHIKEEYEKSALSALSASKK
ncbi:GxxExxY protein [Bacteroides sp.]|uniref:GxxExxY protein n=1 Tax=Bacteroides sp. TaxID=29523 RepID=UPI00345D256A